jgi:hypothetical protein
MSKTKKKGRVGKTLSHHPTTMFASAARLAGTWRASLKVVPAACTIVYGAAERKQYVPDTQCRRVTWDEYSAYSQAKVSQTFFRVAGSDCLYALEPHTLAKTLEQAD